VGLRITHREKSKIGCYELLQRTSDLDFLARPEMDITETECEDVHSG
jgi:hypothetical protein